MLAIFAAFKFDWPPALQQLYEALSLASFNLELLAPECSVSVTFESKWLVTASLPILLLCAVGVVVALTRALQWTQRTVFHVLPFGAASELSMVNVSVGILITGSYYLYFRKSTIAWFRCVRVLCQKRV